MADKSKGFRGIFIACFLLALFLQAAETIPTALKSTTSASPQANSDEPLS